MSCIALIVQTDYAGTMHAEGFFFSTCACCWCCCFGAKKEEQFLFEKKNDQFRFEFVGRGAFRGLDAKRRLKDLTTAATNDLKEGMCSSGLTLQPLPRKKRKGREEEIQ